MLRVGELNRIPESNAGRRPPQRRRRTTPLPPPPLSKASIFTHKPLRRPKPTSSGGRGAGSTPLGDRRRPRPRRRCSAWGCPQTTPPTALSRVGGGAAAAAVGACVQLLWHRRAVAATRATSTARAAGLVGLKVACPYACRRRRSTSTSMTPVLCGFWGHSARRVPRGSNAHTARRRLRMVVATTGPRPRRRRLRGGSGL